MLRRILLTLALALLPPALWARDIGPVLVMGDSLLAVNSGSGHTVAQELARDLGQRVEDRSVAGASYLHVLPISGALGMRISAQFRDKGWDWVVLNGGGNDVMFRCACGRCSTLLNKLISADGRSGLIPQLVAKIRATGAKVIYVGYLRSPGFTSPVEACGPTGDKLDARLAKMDRADDGVWFLPMSDLVPEGDRSFHADDLIHPSAKGSAAIAARIAARITK